MSCFCPRYIMGNRKLKKTTFPFTSSNYEQSDDWRQKWKQLVDKYRLDRIKTHLVKVVNFTFENDYCIHLHN